MASTSVLQILTAESRSADCSERNDRLDKWRAFLLSDQKRLSACPTLDSLIPLYGSRTFAKFNGTEKRSLFIGFAQLNAEALLVFESFAIAAYRLSPEPEARKISVEEFHHSRSYRKFLREEPEIDWPGHSLILKRDRLTSVFRSIVFYLVKRFPIALALPGAKAEAYSVFYAQALKEAFGTWDHNVWSQLNYLHLQDEVPHIDDQFGLFESSFKNLPLYAKLGAALAVAAFFLFVQWIMFSGAWKMNTRAFGQRSRLVRMLITVKMARWIVRDFGPYQRTRKLIRRHFADRKPTWRNLFQFLHW